MAAAEFVLLEVKKKYDQLQIDDFYLRVYIQAEPRLQSAFAYFHDNLNQCFNELNNRITYGNLKAQDSRDLLYVIKEMNQLRADLRRASLPIKMEESYERAVTAVKRFLRETNGSPIPEDFEPIELIRYDPVFSIDLATPVVTKQNQISPLKQIGEGSFALVYKYKDLDYGFQVALKRAKSHLQLAELARFRAEFEVMSKLNHPNILAVYSYNDQNRSYTMEYCECTLREYLERVNSRIPFWARKQIGQQFLLGLKYLSDKQILHRDLSFTNVLVKEYDADLVTLKISDFGLYKDVLIDRTRTGTELKGSLIDPALDNYKNYSLVNEIYAVGHILAFILTGRRNMSGLSGEELLLVHKCTNPDVSSRYQSITDIITGFNALSQP